MQISAFKREDKEFTPPPHNLDNQRRAHRVEDRYRWTIVQQLQQLLGCVQGSALLDTEIFAFFSAKYDNAAALSLDAQWLAELQQEGLSKHILPRCMHLFCDVCMFALQNRALVLDGELHPSGSLPASTDGSLSDLNFLTAWLYDQCDFSVSLI